MSDIYDHIAFQGHGMVALSAHRGVMYGPFPALLDCPPGFLFIDNNPPMAAEQIREMVRMYLEIPR